MNTNGSDTRSITLQDIVARATEFLCKENQHGSWLDARTNAICIWALCNCGVAKAHPKFIKYAINQLLEENSEDEQGLCWNFEIWDTSVSAIAIKKGGSSDFFSRFDEINNWLMEEYSEDERNFRNEPWETLWALLALQYLEPDEDTEQLVKDSIFWVLSKRNREGVLISPHYVGLLLAVMAQAYDNIDLENKEELFYIEAIQQSISYLLDEYREKRKENLLWNDEPWSIGLILFGLARSHKWNSTIFYDSEFNRFLVEWCEKKWNFSLGWVDVVDTSNLLVGLSEYYIQKELVTKGLDESKRWKIQEAIPEKVNYEFREVGPRRMTVYPFWKERKFTSKKNTCCVLMPFSMPWSNKVHAILRKVLEEHSFKVVRPDDLCDRDVLEGIWKAINEARIVIADCTGSNPNVFYELGIAQTIGKETILIAQNIKEDIPFDLISQRVVEYDVDPPHAELEKRLPEVINHIKEGKI